MAYATEAARIEARRASRRRAYHGEDRPKTRFYPETRAPRIDPSIMTPEELAIHKVKQQREKSARYNARHPGLTNGKLRGRRATFPWYGSLLAAGDRSRQRNHEFNLTAEWAAATYTGFCSLTGLPFINSAAQEAGTSGGRPYSPSIDRISPLKGYTQDNCRWVLFAVNSLKGTMTDAEMLTIARALTKN